jgi:hypothetical protein
MMRKTLLAVIGTMSIASAAMAHPAATEPNQSRAVVLFQSAPVSSGDAASQAQSLMPVRSPEPQFIGRYRLDNGLLPNGLAPNPPTYG